ncbi:MAG: Gfo/Idh/MocA family oxidoreductase [Rhizobiaceae bacterium]|nr:Gfo/Idh/MocA family oxidoreductase [Rhizobiaceae bacterium]
MSTPRKVAIIGAGIGEQHLAAYRNLPERFEVAVLCDLDLQRAESIAGDDPSLKLTDDFQSVLNDPEIELIDICLPPHLHFETSMAGLEHGKHVVCEKPLVSSLRDADRLATQAKKFDRILTPVFQYRYGMATAQLRALIEAGLAGRPLVASIETHWNRQKDYYAIAWRGTWAGEQGGAVLGHAIHNHDLLCAFFGPVKRLSALATTRVNDIEVEDCASISFEMENGALASSSITLGAAQDTTRLRFVFEGLTAESGSLPYAPAEDVWRFSARGQVSQDQVDECLAAVPEVGSGFTGFFSALADRLDGDGGRVGAAVTLEDGRRSLELVSAIYHAVRTSRIVELPLGADSPLYEGWTP